MLIGFNNDVEHRGLTFHIQTEDHGAAGHRVETQLFHSGAILDTLLTSYQNILDEFEGEEAEERIRAMMKASHRSLFKKLRAGQYDEMVGLEPLSSADSGEIEAVAEDFTPSQDRVPAAAQQLEEGGEEAIREFEKKHELGKKDGSHVSLDKLKDQLSALKQPARDKEKPAAPDAAVVATEIIDAEGIGLEFSSDLAANHAASKPAQTLTLPKTGARAWDGCKPADVDLSLTQMVEAFIRS